MSNIDDFFDAVELLGQATPSQHGYDRAWSANDLDTLKDFVDIYGMDKVIAELRRIAGEQEQA